MPSADTDYGRSEEIVDACMEWIARRWTKSQIKRRLREIANSYLSVKTCNFVIRQANAKIRKLYNIDPQHYKGKQIAFYESIIRQETGKDKDKLTAAERLDKLFGLEQISGDDPEATARKIREELAAMDESIGGPNDAKSEQRSTDDGHGKTNAEHSTESNGKNGNSSTNNKASKAEQNTPTEEAEPVIENVDEIPEDVQKELNSIKDEDIEKFRKSQKKGV